MKTTRIMTLAVLIIAGGFALHVTRAQQPGIKRTYVLRHDLGDCNGRGAFTHTAYNDFEIIAANLLDGEQRRVSDRVPWPTVSPRSRIISSRFL